MQYVSLTLIPLSVTDPIGAWTNPDDAIVEDGTAATFSVIGHGGGTYPMDFALGGGVPPNAVITGIQVGAKWAYSSTDDVEVDATSYFLYKNSNSYNAVTGAGSTSVGDSLTWIYNGGPSDLWGTTWSPSDFNDGLVTGQVSVGDHNDPGTGTISLDSIDLTLYYTLNGENDMDFYRAAQEAGWKVLYGEALPSLTSAAALFPSTQSGATNRASVDGTRMIVLTLRSAGITIRGDGGTPTAGANGIDYPIGSPYLFSVNDSEAANFNAIENGGTASGWIEYWGLP